MGEEVTKKIVGVFKPTKPERKWEYATIKLKAPAGWSAFNAYGYGPSLYFNGTKLTIHLRREIKKK